MARPSRLPLATLQIEAVALAADMSTKSVRRYLSGESVSASTMRRVERALRAAGHDSAVRAAPGVAA